MRKFVTLRGRLRHTDDDTFLEISASWLDGVPIYNL